MKIPFNVNASTARLIGRENVAKYLSLKLKSISIIL